MPLLLCAAPFLMTPRQPSSVFISYSHRDRQWLDRLNVHLRPLERDGGIVTWDDTRIDPGRDWQAEISAALKEAKVAILLVSADFLASDFIAENELPVLLDRAGEEGTTVLPVILSPSQFRSTELARFQAVNDPDQPLLGMEPVDQERVFNELAAAVETALASDNGSPEVSPPASGRVAGAPRVEERPPRGAKVGLSMMVGLVALAGIVALGLTQCRSGVADDGEPGPPREDYPNAIECEDSAEEDFWFAPEDGGKDGYGRNIWNCDSVTLVQPAAAANVGESFHIDVERCWFERAVVSVADTVEKIAGNAGTCQPSRLGPFPTESDGSATVTVRVESHGGPQFAYYLAGHRG